MKTSTQQLSHKTTKRNRTSAIILASLVLLFSSSVFAQKESDNNKNDNKLIEDYIRSMPLSNIITFDATNIKMFWIDNSVISSNGLINIALTKNSPSLSESPLLKIQLANVNLTLDCRVDVISSTPDIGFTVSSSKGRNLSKSSNSGEFIDYHLSTATFHLEDTLDYSFNLRFNSEKDDSIAIKKIILSFAPNKETFLSSPGSYKIGGDDITGTSYKIIKNNGNTFSVSSIPGKRADVFSKKKILVSDQTLENSATIKNVGNVALDVCIGYVPYTKDGDRIHARNNPYKNKNTILKVLSSSDNSNTIIVDSYPDWMKGCHLALDAKEDLSDFPNFSLTEGAIVEVKKNDDGSAEIILDTPVKKGIKPGTSVRVQSPHGAIYIYTNSKNDLQPGETVVFPLASIQKDDDFLEYSRKALCKGTYYVTPVILIASKDAKEEAAIEISDFIVSY